MLWTLARTLPQLITIPAGYFIYERASIEMFFCLIQGHDRVLLVVFFLVDASVPFLALPPKFLSLHVFSISQWWKLQAVLKPSFTGPRTLLLGTVPKPTRLDMYTMPAKAPQRHSQLSFPNGTTPPTAGKGRPIFSAHCKRSTKLENKQNYHPKSANTMGTQGAPMVSNYGVVYTKWRVSISKHHVNAWCVYV
jgi:hypothetical protein